MQKADGILNPEAGTQPGTVRRLNSAYYIPQQRDSQHSIDDGDPLENFAPTLKIGKVGTKFEEEALLQ